MYCWAQEAALSVTNNIVQSDSEILEVKVCTAALRLMLQILNWEFQYNTNGVEGTKKSINVFSSGVRIDVSSAKRSDYALVQVTSLFISNICPTPSVATCNIEANSCFCQKTYVDLKYQESLIVVNIVTG